ncbi:hypothetical protein BH23VER1_BH23VER1_13080 [soil metagenome]
MRGERITQVEYSSLQAAYDHFNAALLRQSLPGALITLQRKNGAGGYFHQARFIARDSSESADEIALNPDVFAGINDTEIMQTLVHEMIHQWQYYSGNPSRRCYHNQEWAAKMEEVGFMPSSTGKPGGRKVGQSIADYVIDGGRFDATWKDLQKGGFKIRWQSRDLHEPLTISASINASVKPAGPPGRPSPGSATGPTAPGSSSRSPPGTQAMEP